MALTKSLVSAHPTIVTATGITLTWGIVIRFSEGGFNQNYSYFVEVEEENKTPLQFTQVELMSYAPADLEAAFEEEYASWVPPETTTDFNFDVSSLPVE